MLAIVTAGELSLPLSPSRRLQQVSLADLGTLVAALLERPGEFAGQRIEVAGDEPTPREMAEALGAAGNRPVSYRRADLSGRSSDIAAMFGYLERTGYQVVIPLLRERFPDMTWTSFADWALRQIATS